MNRKNLSLVLIIVLTLTLTACSKAEDGTGTNSATSQTGESGNPQQFKQADLTGEVTDIVGNEVTLKIIKVAERPNNTITPNQNDSTAAPSGGQGRPNNSQGNPDGVQGTPEGNRGIPNGEMPNRDQVQREYTGEEKSMIIPVGLKITTMARGQGEATQSAPPIETEVKLENIKVGNLLQIYYAADGKTIDKIMVSTQMGGRTNGTNAASIPSN